MKPNKTSEFGQAQAPIRWRPKAKAGKGTGSQGSAETQHNGGTEVLPTGNNETLPNNRNAGTKVLGNLPISLNLKANDPGVTDTEYNDPKELRKLNLCQSEESKAVDTEY